MRVAQTRYTRSYLCDRGTWAMDNDGEVRPRLGRLTRTTTCALCRQPIQASDAYPREVIWSRWAGQPWDVIHADDRDCAISARLLAVRVAWELE